VVRRPRRFVSGSLIVDQFVPTLLGRDAVGSHTLRTQEALRSVGIEGGVWATVIGDDCADRGRVFTDWVPRNGSAVVLLYQVASVSGGIVEFLASLPHALSIYYHDLTPAEFYDPWDVVEADGMRRAAAELEKLASRVRIAISTSRYGANDLYALNIPEVVVCPPFLGTNVDLEPDPQLLSTLTGSPGLRLLFVGRIAPNKGHRHLLQVLAAVRAGVDPDARLYLIGALGPREYVRALAREADIVCEGAAVITGPVDDAELAAHYRAADVFLCMSEHEGFGIPLVEAMERDVPVVALDTTAVGETLGGAGILLSNPDPLLAAEAIARVAGDAGLRESVVRRQRQRARELIDSPRAEILAAALRRAAEMSC
jgi:glycosyltransferase involved in cell wall biosynthesis